MFCSIGIFVYFALLMSGIKGHENHRQKLEYDLYLCFVYIIRLFIVNSSSLRSDPTCHFKRLFSLLNVCLLHSWCHPSTRIYISLTDQSTIPTLAFIASLCSPFQLATDSISAPCRLPDSQAAREANALITACHMMGLAWVLSNKASMSTFNCLHRRPLPIEANAWVKHTQTHTHNTWERRVLRCILSICDAE